jgi:hypothetical protein
MNPRFIYPPHPSKHLKITPQMLDQHERQKAWVAQRKFNGTHVVIWLYNDKVAMWDRRGITLSSYQLTPQMEKMLLTCFNRDDNKEYVLDGELLHTKAKLKTTKKQAVDNTIVLFDILYAGKPLTDLTTLERLDLLAEVAPTQGMEQKKRAQFVSCYDNSQVWLAETFYDDFSYRFWEFYDYDSNNNDRHPELEGLVLKNSTAKNSNAGARPNDVLWMLRCRKTKEKMYQF